MNIWQVELSIGSTLIRVIVSTIAGCLLRILVALLCGVVIWLGFPTSGPSWVFWLPDLLQTLAPIPPICGAIWLYWCLRPGRRVCGSWAGYACVLSAIAMGAVEIILRRFGENVFGWNLLLEFACFSSVTVAGIWVFTRMRPGDVSPSRRWKHRKRQGNTACTVCGYDLTGNTSGVCPECGTEVEQR